MTRAIRIATGMLLSAAAAVQAQTPFTLVVLPDTQYYTQTDANNNQYFKGQTNWIVANRQNLNIAFVMHLGDIQNNGNPYYEDGTPTPWLNGNESQWVRADASLDILDNAGVPYSLVPGNHDYLHYDMPRQEPGYYLKWFGPQRFAGKPTFGGSSPATPTSYAGLNTYYKFSAGGYTFLNLALQYAPDSYDLAWAQDIINKNPGLPTIVTTHALLEIGGYDNNDGDRRNVYDTFLKNNPQVVMTMNGHRNGEYRQTETNIAGQPLHQMLVDFQNLPFDPYFQGGGYLRTMSVDTVAGRVDVKTYSPIIGAYQSDADSQFSLNIDFKKRFGAADKGGTSATASFRDGVNGYAGTVDAYTSATAPTSNLGTTAYAWVDGDEDTSLSGKQQAQAFLRFDNLIGADAVPQDASIDGATLTLHTSLASNAQSAHTMSLYRLLVPWSEASTYASIGGALVADGLEAILAANGTVSPTAQDMVMTFDVAESLAAWADGAPNYGWILIANGTDGWRFDTSEAALLTDRPRLDVTFRPNAVPEPACTALLALAAPMLRRRPRPRHRRHLIDGKPHISAVRKMRNQPSKTAN